MKYGMLINLERCIGCSACAIACKQENGTAADIFWCNIRKGETGTYPDAHMVQIPWACMHCTNAACVEVCPTGASYKAEDGRTLIDYELCIGCESCATACPYGVRQFTSNDATKNADWGAPFDATPFEEMKSKNRAALTAQKCEMCPQRLEQGLAPACVATCITGCRVFGDLDDPNSDISKKIAEGEVVQASADLGLDPHLYYIGDLSVIPEYPQR